VWADARKLQEELSRRERLSNRCNREGGQGGGKKVTVGGVFLGQHAVIGVDSEGGRYRLQGSGALNGSEERGAALVF